MSKIMSHRQPLTAHHPNRPTSSYIDEEFISLPVSDAIGNFQPSIFTPLKDLEEHKLVNVIAVVAEFKEITRSARGRRDFLSCLTLCDPSRSLVGTGLLCFFFDSKMEDLPAPVNTGEILIAYDIRIKPYNLDIQAWSTHSTRFKLVSPGFNLRTLKVDEFNQVKELQEWWSIRGGAPGAKGEIIKRDKEGKVINEDEALQSRKMSYIGGMIPNKFYDIVCEVVKSYPGYPHTLYLADYTQNTSLFAYNPDKHRDWKGPFGQYTLPLECWETVADLAQNCKVGQYYLFKNVRAKKNREDHLEASLNPDQRYPEKIQIERADMSTPSVKAVLKRKKDYLLRLEVTLKEYEKQALLAEKRAREQYPSDDDSQPKQKKQKENEQSSQSSQSSKKRSKHSKRKSIEEEIVAPKISRSVQSEYPTLPPVSISQIVSTNTSSLRPRKMRILCRVRDFLPKSLADFAVAWCTLCNDTWKISSSPVCPQCNVPPSSPEGNPYKWQFALLLEDSQGDTLPVIVAEGDASGLLQLQPDNLHENPKLLAQLRHRLFLLWGDLEESTGPSRSPPKPIRKSHHDKRSRKEPPSVRFSDDISYDDDSSSSLSARHRWNDDGPGRGGSKIVKALGTEGLSGKELRRGVWFEASLKEFWVRETEAVFGQRRWRLFGTRILFDLSGA